MLEVKDLTKNFGGVTAVDNLTFNVNQSEILGLIGPNGAGKSTVFGLISGIYPPTSGKIIFENKDITGFETHRIAKLGIGRIFQSSVIFGHLTVTENVFIAHHLSYKTNIWKQILRFPSARKEEILLRRRGEEILEKTGLGSMKNEIAKNLSHGYQRILSVSIALATKPKMLLLDEPFTGMNQNEILTMTKLVRWIQDSGVTIVLIEHNMPAIMSLSDRVIVMDRGRKIAEGLPKDIQDNEQVIDAYLGKE